MRIDRQCRAWTSRFIPSGVAGLTLAGTGSASAAEFEAMTDSQYERLFAVPAIIYGLALAKLVGELGRMLRSSRSIPKSPSQTIWILVLLVFILVMFFAGAKYVPPLNHFGVFLSTIVLALLLYLAADALVIPNERDLTEERNFRTEFQARSRHFIAYAFLALLWMSARDSLVFLGDAQEAARVARENALRGAVSLILLIPFALPRPWTHIPIGVLSVAALFYHIYTSPGFLRPMVEGS